MIQPFECTRLETLKEKTPEIEELHQDGAYDSEKNDKKCSELSISPIQTAIRGKASAIDMTIDSPRRIEVVKM